MSRIAVVLFNLGGPDRTESIGPFLKNFFMDPAIIGAPLPIRYLLSRLIAWRRSRNQAGSAYARLGGASPLLANTERQAAALQAELAHDPHHTYTVHICMRYWHPLSDVVAAQVAHEKPDQIVLLPLYPQFSTTTSGSSLTDWDRAARQAGITAPTQAICCYHDDPGFIAASARSIRSAYEALAATLSQPVRILFSAHGLPEKIIRGGDPYQAQCEQTAAAIVAALGVPNLDWQICYQSRVGPLKWIGPSTEEALHKAARDQVGVVIYPHAFVSEHVETLVEIEEEYRHLATELGVPGFARAGTVMDDPDFVGGLAALVRGALTRAGATDTIASGRGPCRCDLTRTQCPMQGG